MKNLKCIPYDEAFDDGNRPVTPVSQEAAELVKLLGLPEHTIGFTLQANMNQIFYVDCTYWINNSDTKRERFALVPVDQEPT